MVFSRSTLRKVPHISNLSKAPRDANSVDKVVVYKRVVHYINRIDTNHDMLLK